MSNLLFNKYPIVISQELAGLLTNMDKRKYPRISEAAVLQQVNYWLEKKQNYRDGRYWVYNSLESWMKQFTWIKTKATMKKQFDYLENLGIIVTGNYNKAKFDRTKWYSIDYNRLEALYDAFYKDNNMDVINTDTPMLSTLANGSYKDNNDNTIDYTKTTQKLNNNNNALDDDRQRVFAKAEQLFKLTPLIIEDLNYDLQEHDVELLLYAMEVTARSAERVTFNYYKSVLSNWDKRGLKTVSEVNKYEEERANKNKKFKQRKTIDTNDANVGLNW